MEPLIARAFLTLLMSSAQIEELCAFEKTLPPGRYLQGFELVRRYGINADPLDPDREAKMMVLFRDWEGKNWKKNQIEDKFHAERCITIAKDKWCNCRTRQEEVHEWIDYMLKKWIEPLPKMSGNTSSKFDL